MSKVQMPQWDAGEPFDAMAENFRRQITTMVLNADRVAIYRQLDSMKQIECFIAGTVTALIGVCFSSIMPEGRDEMMKVITQYIPQAREQVEAMIDPAGIKHQDEGK